MLCCRKLWREKELSGIMRDSFNLGMWLVDLLSPFFFFSIRIPVDSFSLGTQEIIQAGHIANKYPPELKTHDRYGNRIDVVEYHPAYHQLMKIGNSSSLLLVSVPKKKKGMEGEIHSFAWKHHKKGAMAARIARYYLMGLAENGVTCPLTMTFAAVPALKVDYINEMSLHCVV